MSPAESTQRSDEDVWGFPLDPAVPIIPLTEDKPKRDTARALFATAAGGAHVIEPPPAEVPPEAEPTYLDKLRADIRRGNDVLDKPRTSWLVRGWIPQRSVGLVFGAPGSGKSFYALSLALELARGGRWVGQPLDPATVLYVAAERAEVLGDRQEAWVAHYGAPIPNNYVELSAAPGLRNDEALDALCEIIRQYRPALVVVDTLARVTVGTN